MKSLFWNIKFDREDCLELCDAEDHHQCCVLEDQQHPGGGVSHWPDLWHSCYVSDPCWHMCPCSKQFIFSSITDTTNRGLEKTTERERMLTCCHDKRTTTEKFIRILNIDYKVSYWLKTIILLLLLHLTHNSIDWKYWWSINKLNWVLLLGSFEPHVC